MVPSYHDASSRGAGSFPISVIGQSKTTEWGWKKGNTVSKNNLINLRKFPLVDPFLPSIRHSLYHPCILVDANMHLLFNISWSSDVEYLCSPMGWFVAITVEYFLDNVSRL